MKNELLREIYAQVGRSELSSAGALERIRALRDAQAKGGARPSPSARGYAYHDSYVRDHLVERQRILLGVTHAALALDFVRAKTPHGAAYGVRRLTFVEPVVLPEGREVSVSVSEQGGDGEFAVLCRASARHRSPDEDGASVAARGAFNPRPAPRPAAVDLKPFMTAPAKVVLAREIYGQNEQIVHGPSLQSVRKIYVKGEQALGRLVLSDEMAAEPPYGSLHPSLLDGAIMASAVLLPPETRSQPFIPLMIRELTVYGQVANACYCLASLSKVNEEVTVCDIRLLDADGTVTVDMVGVTCKRIRTGAAREDGRTEAKAVEASAAVGLGAQIEQYLTGKLSELIGRPGPLAPDVNFMDLGAESSGLIAMASQIEKELGFDLYPTVFFEYPNLAELAAFLEREHGEAFRAHFHAGQPADAAGPTAQPASAPRAARPAPASAAGDKEDASRIDAPLAGGDDRIAIIGMAGRYADAADLGAFWENTVAGKELITEVPADHWDYRPWFDERRNQADKTYCKWGSFVDDVAAFDAGFFGISRKEAETMDPQQRLVLQALYHAAEDAGYGARIRGSATGVFIGCCFYDYAQEMCLQGKAVAPHDGTGNAATMLANRPSFFLDLRGPSLTLDTACSSSLVALDMACDSLRRGACGMAFVGGVNLLLSSWHYRYFSSINALSATGRCHSFDQQADGYVPGEGVGVVLLKPYARALADGDRIHAVIAGSAVAHGGHTPSPTAPSVKMETQVLLEAWKRAGIDPASLAYVEAHGTGTPLGDPIEIEALKAAFAEHTKEQAFCALGTAKAQIGHTEGAAGITGVIRAVLAIQHKTIPAMHGFETLNPYVKLERGPVFIPRGNLEWPARDGTPRRAGVSSFGFGGTYAHVVLEEAPAAPAQAGSAAAPWTLIAVSAKSKASQRARLAELRAWLDGREHADLERLAFTLNATRAHWEKRTAFVVQSGRELVQALDAVLAGGETPFGVSADAKARASAGEDLPALYQALDAASGADEARRQLMRIAQCYVEGANPDWRRLGAEGPAIDAPLYPFETEHFWFDRQARAPAEAATGVILPEVLPEEAVRPVKAIPAAVAASPEAATVHRAEVEAKAIGILSEILLLPAEQIEMDAELAGLGVDSIMTMQFVVAVNKAFGLHLSAAALYSASQVGQVVDVVFLAVAGQETPAPASVRDQPAAAPAETLARPAPKPVAPPAEEPPKARIVLKGTPEAAPPPPAAASHYRAMLSFNDTMPGTPIFLVHPGGAGAESYIKLANYLDGGQPVHAIESYNLYSGEAPIRTITELAALYLKHVRGVQPRGPYFLGGWSRGGMVAFEMAQQLFDAGERVETLYLLDSYVMNEQEKTVAIDNVMKHSMLPGGVASFRDLLKNNLAVERISNVVYQPRPYPGRAVLFKANQQLETRAAKQTMELAQTSAREVVERDSSEQVAQVIDNLNAFINEDTVADFNRLGAKPDNGWSRYIENLSIRIVDGNHFSIMEERTLRPIARHIQSDMDATRYAEQAV
ncbi:beta-ketoacyl synthase N-terminal-like domain-containing protein [Chromobacterium vaccinii]|uniref:beta-ketoacyl synthase N-terminal-like domain-containing protein n=1 Tax=Chromobacterium vaccinii TaxID=1108595 RepID=UPI003C73F76B